MPFAIDVLHNMICMQDLLFYVHIKHMQLFNRIVLSVQFDNKRFVIIAAAPEYVMKMLGYRNTPKSTVTSDWVKQLTLIA